MGHDLFLLSCGCDSSGYYRVVHGTALIPNETQFPCWTLVPCLVWVQALGCAEMGGAFVAKKMRLPGRPPPDGQPVLRCASLVGPPLHQAVLGGLRESLQQ